jgi:hypothetical protein
VKWLVTHCNKEIVAVSLLQGPAETGAFVVEADTYDQARDVAAKQLFNMYCATKKAQTTKRHHAESRCACGRNQDRKHPDGSLMKSCSVCAETLKKCPSRSGAPARPRDEPARVEKNLERQRDRRQEIRRETLIEVRRRFWEEPHVRDFANWLDEELK